MADAGDLEKLPLEIRKQIYTHLLAEPRSIALKCHKNSNGQTEVIRKSHTRKANHYRRVGAYGWHLGQNIRANVPLRVISILLTNRMISQEAAPVLYNSNEFFFDDAADLHEFLTCIGQSKRHIRHVELDGHGIMHQASHTSWTKTNEPSWTKMDRSLGLLEAAKDLRALNLYHHGFCGRSPRVDIIELAHHCTSLLQSLQATWAARNLNADILEVVKIVLPPCHCELCPGPREECRPLGCRKGHTHARHLNRMITMPGDSTTKEVFVLCSCLCKAAGDTNRLLNKELRKEIASCLGLSN